MIRARVFAICCGYEDADDLDDGERLWTDLRVWAYRGEIVLVSGRASRRPDRLDLKPPGGWRAVDADQCARAAICDGRRVRG